MNLPDRVAAGDAAALACSPTSTADRPGGGAVDRLLGYYLLLSGFALAFSGRPASWPLLAAAHAGGAWLALRPGDAVCTFRPLARRFPSPIRWLRDWYPLLLVPMLYSVLEPLNRAVHDGRYFDALVMHWEELLFRGQPALDWASAAPIVLLSEALHAAYLSYYLIIYGPPLILYLQGRRDAFRLTVFALMLAFLAHYIFFIYFPVQGPRYLFPPPGGALADGFFYGLTHQVLEAGSSQGAAFPSSHVGIAVVQTVLAARLLPRLAPALAVLGLGLAAGTVYGGFHYAIDALAGLLLGLAAAAAAPRLMRRLEPAG